MTNNTIELFGQVTGDAVLNHIAYGEKFYTLGFSVDRLSESKDHLEVIVSEKLMFGIEAGTYLHLFGEVRTYNKNVEGKNKLIIAVFAKESHVVTDTDAIEDLKATNAVTIKGFLCKTPVLRSTPFGKQITDLLIAVNRRFHKSDYIPCIAWGRNAIYANHFEVGQAVEATGRLQSREYTKRLEDGTTETRTAYEFSISNIAIANEDDCKAE